MGSVEKPTLPRLRHPGRTQTSNRPRCRRNAPDQIRAGAKSPAAMRKQGLFASCPLARCLQWEKARVRVCEVVGASSTEQSQPASPSRPAIEPESAEPHAPANRRRNLGPGRARLAASAAEVTIRVAPVAVPTATGAAQPSEVWSTLDSIPVWTERRHRSKPQQRTSAAKRSRSISSILHVTITASVKTRAVKEESDDRDCESI